MEKNYEVEKYSITTFYKDSCKLNPPWKTQETRYRIVSIDTGEILDDNKVDGYKTAKEAYSAYVCKTTDNSKQ
jgi:hypothetical protein